MINANDAARITEEYHNKIKAKVKRHLPMAMDEIESLIICLASNGEGNFVYNIEDYFTRLKLGINGDVVKELTNQLADQLLTHGFQVTRETDHSLCIVWYN